MVEFAPNEDEQFFSIQLLPDNEREATESFVVYLSPFAGPVRVDLNQRLTVSILDTDGKSNVLCN